MGRINRGSVIFLFVGALLSAPFALFQQTSHASACVSPSVDYGRVTSSASLPAGGTYRIWTRMYVPNTENNTYLLEIDGNTCFNVGGSGVSVGSWVWVAFQNGSTTSRTDAVLTEGAHSIKLIGNKPGVKIDRLVFSTDLNCVPTGFGDNCDVPDDKTPPSTVLTGPTEGETVSGTAVALSANISDANGVNRAEFFVDGVRLSADTTSPYSAIWNSMTVANGVHNLSVRGYDTSGNMSSSTVSVIVSNGDTQAPTTPTNLGASATSATVVRLQWNASSDNTGIAGYTVFRNDSPLVVLSDTNLSYEDSSVSPSTTYRYAVEARDEAGNRSARTNAVSVTTPASQVADTTKPSQPTNVVATAVSTSQIDLIWSPSSDNVGVVAYDIYSSSGTVSPKKIASTSSTSFGDTSLVAGTSYTYYVVARDSAGNVSSPSASVSAQTKAVQSPQVNLFTIGGRVTGPNGKKLSGVRVQYTESGVTHTTQTNKYGKYAFQGLTNGTYRLTTYKKGYKTYTATLVVDGKNITKDMKLQRN